MPEKPKTIVYLRPDTIGDLILFTPALGTFMAEWPDARHVIVVRRGYEDVAPLFPASVEWLTASFNPFRERPSECREPLAELLGKIEALQPDLILAPTLNRTWLELAVAAHFPHVRSMVLGSAAVDPVFAASLKLDLGIAPAQAFGVTVAANPGVGDVANQHHFAETVIGHPAESNKPEIRLDPSATRRAAEILSGMGLPALGFAAVFPGGLANVPVKAWTAEGFAALTLWLQTAGNLPVAVLAHESERQAVEDIVSRVVALGGRPPHVWIGRDGELPLLAALLAQARIYVGHDTGAMHLAAAAGRPVVGIFGGGHWPRFRPAAAQGLAVVQPLPCFGCNWDCHFEDGPCVKTIAAADVIAAVKRMLGAGEAPVDAVFEVERLPVEARALIAAALPRLTALTQDRLDRQYKIEELKSETDRKDVEIADLKQAADDRKREMESIKAELEQECADKDAEIADLKGEADTKDTEIIELKAAAEARKQEMESIKAELEQECAVKDREIGELKAAADTKDVEIDALKLSCDQREKLVIELDGGLKAHLAAAAARDNQIAALQDGRKELEAQLELFRSLPPDTGTLAESIRHKDVHIANLEAMLRHRDEEMALQRQSLANYATGYAHTEQARHYGQLLAQKEQAIQELHRACVERAEVIKQLAAETTGPTAAMRKLWIATSAFFRERLVRPVSTFAFRRLVENYWMQIGVLRQYEPRPIQWDPKLRTAPDLPPSLPQIGLVTPSYGQAPFLESTLLSVLNQNYPRLLYAVQDGGSKDASPEIIDRYRPRLEHGVSEKDSGQADAIRRGFAAIEPKLGPEDVMAWLNSDDLLAPRSLAFVGSYFAAHPDVDVIYGHRIIIDHADQEVGRWIMPRHEHDSIEWIDYVPQETMFWRKRAWDLAGGIDPTFHFALDWDLLARFQQAGCRMVRIPYFLGCFRVHSEQKTHQLIHSTGATEMARIRLRFHGSEKDNAAMIEQHARRIRVRGALSARLQALGVRW